MPRKEMTVDESIRMTKRPYRNNLSLADYSAEEAFALPEPSGYTYTGEGASGKAGAGRGGQGGPTAEQARQNRGMMSEAERGARDEAKAKKEQSDVDKVYGKSRATPYAKGGKTASSRADGIAQKGKTRGKMC